MTKVKICGITTAGDARDALLFGADYLGFILYEPSPRCVTVKQVSTIVRELKHDSETGPILARSDRPLLVGVFVNEQPEAMAEALAICSLDLAQLSGEEDAALATNPESVLFGCAYHALRPQSAAMAREACASFSAPTSDGAPTLLLDAFHPTLRGGTGETADWQLAADLTQITPRLMLAGGLTPENVAGAIRQAQPFAVDVASGVEASRGRKDPEKVRRFIVAAYGAGEQPKGS